MPSPATCADMLRRLGREGEAPIAYRAAIALTNNLVERGFLKRRLGELAACGQREQPPR